MIVRLAKPCVYVLLSCLALFVIEIKAINHGAISAAYKQLLGITLKSSEQSSLKPSEMPNKIDDMVYQGFFYQRVNHFNFKDKRTWLQKMYVSKKYSHEKSSPVILLLGGLQELTYSDFQSGIWDEMARETGALLLGLEHRYRGLSKPTSDLSTENLLYLNSEQAVADAAAFMWKVRKNELSKFVNGDNTLNWIVVGAYHGGALAANLKLKFPHITRGALAVSAPLLAKEEFTDYYEEIFSELRKNADIMKVVDKVYLTILQLTSQEDILELQPIFKLCPPKGKNYKTKDKPLFLWSITTFLGFILQPKTLNPKSLTDKAELMEILRDESKGTALEIFGKAFEKLFTENFKTCLNINFDDAVSSYKNTSWNSKIDDLLYYGLGNRQDLYQSCTQYGQFDVYKNYVPLSFYVNLCEAVFGESYGLYNLKQGVIRTNMFYGGLEMSVPNVYFISHSLDYFIRLGITNKVPENSEAVCITGPFYVENENTSRETSTRSSEWDTIVSNVKEWTKLMEVVDLDDEDPPQDQPQDLIPDQK